METDQEDLQFLGFFGIIKESYKIITTWRKLFTKITLTLILPLAFIALAQIQISKLLYFKLFFNQMELNYLKPGTTRYKALSDLITHEWIIFILFQVSYFIFLIVLSLLSTSAVVYTVACVYTSKEISFKKVMNVVPKVWKRLMITFLCNLTISFIYNFIFLIISYKVIKFFGLTVAGLASGFLLSVVFLAGFVYITLIWQLASVVSVLEDLYGIRAMIKSMDLIKGKMRMSLSLFFVFVVISGGVGMFFKSQVVHFVPGLAVRVGIGLICLVLLVITHLFMLVVQTVIYFVCKSYHHQNIDKSLLTNHLEYYQGEYVPLKSKDVQLEHNHV